MLNRTIKPCYVYKTRKNMRKNVTFALSITIPKAPMGRGWTDIYTYKA